VSVDGGVIHQKDDLTYQYGSIIKANNFLSKNNDKVAHIQDQATLILQHHVTCLFDNTLPGMPRARHSGGAGGVGGKKIKSISERLKGKEGRVRGNLMGKRVDFSARSVITPDPSLQLNQLGVPTSIARHLTFPETVNDRNKLWLKKFVDNGSRI